MVLVTGALGDDLIRKTEELVRAVYLNDHEHIWHKILDLDNQAVVSEIYYPLSVVGDMEIKDMLSRKELFGLGLGFQMDSGGVRQGFFDGLRSNFLSNNWHNLDDDDYMVFAEGDSAIVINGSSSLTFFMTFKKDEAGIFHTDLVSWLVFSMSLKPSRLFDVALRLHLAERSDDSNWYFESASKLASRLSSLEKLVVQNPLVHSRVTTTRIAEILNELKYSIEASIRSDKSKNLPIPVNPQWILKERFKNFESSANTHLSDEDMESLHQMSDADLRKAIAELILGVNKQELRREARKPHGPAEIADMVLHLETESGLFTLCMPIKSGREIRKGSVPESTIHQIWRPFVILDNAIVIFITDRPCSQNLRQLAEMSMSKLGWPIAILEDQDLARWLKVNGRLGSGRK